MPHFILPAVKTAFVLATLITLFATSTVEAKPKRLTNGCTDAQIQSAAAGQCIDKLQDDLLSNGPTYHMPYCSSTGKMLCCEYDEANHVVDHSCEVIASHANPKVFDPGRVHDFEVQSLGSEHDDAPDLPRDEVVLY
jgi:hypothetical protein